ncbi:MAG TPA: zinc-binding dehydrogenase [Gaiellaceae bacterium]|nr:zinc-binding dehydrogenase [Gaiellaceae bacterium]
MPLLPRRPAEPVRAGRGERRARDADGRHQPPAPAGRHGAAARSHDRLLRRADGGRERRCRAAARRAAALAGRVARLWGRDGAGRRAQRRPRAGGRLGRGLRLRRRGAAGRRRRPARRRRDDRRRRPRPEKLELARAQGATHAVDAGGKPVSEIRALTGGGVDVAFEVVGRPETVRLAWGAIRPGGTVVVVGLAPKGVDACVPAIEFLSDKSLRGTYYGSGDPAAELPEYARLALAGALDLARVVTHVDELDGVERALERLRRGEGARTVLVVDPALAGDVRRVGPPA